MWLYELLAPIRTLSATARFRESFKAFRKTYASIDKTLRDFIEFRLSHRSDEVYSAKDTPFTGGELRGFRHIHLVHGRVILIYQITQEELRLCLVMDHSYSSKGGKSSLVNYLHSSSTSYDPLSFGKPAVTLSKIQLADISELFFAYAAQDRNGLEKAISGDLSELMEFIRLVIQEPSWSKGEKDRATLAAYGGTEGLRQAVQRVLQQTKFNSKV
jgi:mRNA-degrading endonuclease YafQ of YafQ-DinJ toxin-antitoxin module